MSQGIETLYRGTRFRSRAEARWAAFFDCLGWRWQYEPVDLDGYIPDFIVAFRRSTLIEVKGGVLPQNLTGSEQTAMALSKVEVSGWDGPSLVVGSGPCFSANSFPLIGVFATTGGEESRDASIFRCGACGSVSLVAIDGSWACRMCGAYDGDRYVTSIEDESLSMWAHACNATQWRGGRQGQDVSQTDGRPEP